MSLDLDVINARRAIRVRVRKDVVNYSGEGFERGREALAVPSSFGGYDVFSEPNDSTATVRVLGVDADAIEVFP